VWANSCLPSRNATLRSDTSKNLHVVLYDIGFLGRSCIFPKCELSELFIPIDSAASFLDLFWGNVVGEFYDPLLAIQMLRVL